MSPPKRKGPGRPRKNPLVTAAESPVKKPLSSATRSVGPNIVMNEQDFFDQHNDFCEVCNRPGELLCCATCNLVFHVDCARPRLNREPPDDWKCAYCWADGVMGGKKDGKERRKAAQACREMERMRREIREKRERRKREGLPEEEEEEEAKEEGEEEEDEEEEEEESGEEEEEMSDEEEEMSDEEEVSDEDEEESGEEEEEEENEEESNDDEDFKKPAAAFTERIRPPVEVAAAAGCRKCMKEVATGEKTRKVHDDFCPRKYRTVGRPGAGRPKKKSGGATKAKAKLREEDDEEEEEVVEEEEEPTPAKDSPKEGGKASLEDGAAAGCIKCRKELETGEKTRKVHADHCPRKYRGHAPKATSSPSAVPEATIKEEPAISRKYRGVPQAASSRHAVPEATTKDEPAITRRHRGVRRAASSTRSSSPPSVLRRDEEDPADIDEEIKIADLKSPPEEAPGFDVAAIALPTQSDVAATALPISSAALNDDEDAPIAAPTKRRGPGRPPSKKSPGRPGRPPKNLLSGTPICPPATSSSASKRQRTTPQDNPVTLAEAAAAGCKKCRKELATGEKTRKTHDDSCPRKWRAAGRPPAGIPSPASADAAALRMVDRGQVAVAAVKSPVVPPRDRGGGGRGGSRSPGRSPGRPKGWRKKRARSIDDAVSPAAAASMEEDEVAVAAIGDLAEATAKDQGSRESDEQQQQEDKDFVNMSAPDAGERKGNVHEEEVKNLKGGGEACGTIDAGDNVMLNIEAEELPAKVPSSEAAQGPASDTFQSGTAHEDEEAKAASKSEGLAELLRGGGRTKKSPVKLLEGESSTAEHPSPSVASAFKSPSSPQVHSSGASTPNIRELEGLEVPTPLKLAKEHELTYSNVGRVQRSRKRPAIYEPDVSRPDSKWGSEDGDTSPIRRRRLVDVRCEVVSSPARGDVGPEPLRGGARPKKEDSAASSSLAPDSVLHPPRPRGRPPTKRTKHVHGGTKKKNAKRAPIKKETNTNIHGVGILNRKPGSLFDCPVCLDLPKIKVCCYCACRICFNKFGKEQTILCDKCDQEYHTFCLGLDKIPDEEWECQACIEDEKKKRVADQKKKEREAKKKIEEEKRKGEETRKAAATAKRRAAYQERKNQEEERKRLQSEKRQQQYQRRKQKEADLRAQGIFTGGNKDVQAATIVTRKRGPGRPPKAETIARMQAQLLLQQQQAAAAAAQPIKRGRGRPRKDGSAPIPRKLPTKSEISMKNLYVDVTDVSVERSRSGRKIQRTVFHDEIEGGGLMKRQRTDSEQLGSVPGPAATRGAQASMYVAERSAAAAAKCAIAGRAHGHGGATPRRKPGARECMQMSRKFGSGVIEQKYFDVLMDYSRRGKVDHLIRMRERMDEHSRFLESQLAGLESLVKEKGEWNGNVPVARPKSDGDA
mmetsp:Transcript_15532/g.37236  ORF Transcript_15532/g.37236 Transcript_15532/m.37236 type:complete len:1403 (-) Transcript_15532:2548-6756(-)